MVSISKSARRRSILNLGLAAGAGSASALFAPTAVADGSRSGSNQDVAIASNRAFGRVDEASLRADDESLPLRARSLIRIGDDGIARENRVAMEDFFDPQFRFHGPKGVQLNREQLWAYFAACRAAFDDFTVTRQALVSDGDRYMAARTRFAGVFARTFTGLPEGAIQPNGKPFEYRIVNIFRYGSDGRLAEEWAQYDTQSFIDQLKQ